MNFDYKYENNTRKIKDEQDMFQKNLQTFASFKSYFEYFNQGKLP